MASEDGEDAHLVEEDGYEVARSSRRNEPGTAEVVAGA